MSALTDTTSAAEAFASRNQNHRYNWIVLAGCLAIFGLLHNPYWSRGGDSDVYLAIARNVLQGKGLTFNNNPVAVVPPLWPWVLAGAMKISGSFAFLKLIPLCSMTAAMFIWYRISLRYVPARTAGLTILLCAGISQVFMLALWFHTEAFYCLLSSLAVLLAMQINEGRSFWWRALMIITLLVGSVFTRWAGVTWWAIVAGALFRGDFPRLDRRTALAVVSLVIVLCSFVMMRKELKVQPDQIDPRYDSSLAGSYELAPEVTAKDYFDRAITSGNWFSGLFWQAAREFRPLRIPSLAAGWVVLILLCARTYFDGRRLDWLLLGAMLQAGMLCMGWPSAVARYLVPMAPLFLLGMIRMGLPQIAPRFRRPALPRSMMRRGILEIRALRRWRPGALRAFVGSILVCNAASFVIEVYVAHRKDYYAHYQAGLNDELLDISRYINEQEIPEGKICLNRVDVTFNRARISNGWLRAFSVTTARSIRHLPAELEGERSNPNRYSPDDPTVIAWLQSQGITHYLYRGASNTMWHFRRTSSAESEGEWQLYEIKDGQAIRIDPPEVNGWPKHLPGLQADF